MQSGALRYDRRPCLPRRPLPGRDRPSRDRALPGLPRRARDQRLRREVHPNADVNERCLLGRPAYRTRVWPARRSVRPRWMIATFTNPVSRSTGSDARSTSPSGDPRDHPCRRQGVVFVAASCLGTRASSETPVPASNATWRASARHKARDGAPLLLFDEHDSDVDRLFARLLVLSSIGRSRGPRRRAAPYTAPHRHSDDQNSAQQDERLRSPCRRALLLPRVEASVPETEPHTPAPDGGCCTKGSEKLWNLTGEKTYRDSSLMTRFASHLWDIFGRAEHGSSHHRSTHRIYGWFVRQPRRGVGVSPGAIRAGAAPASVGRQRCCRHYRVACDSTLRSPARPLGRTRGSFRSGSGAAAPLLCRRPAVRARR